MTPVEILTHLTIIGLLTLFVLGVIDVVRKNWSIKDAPPETRRKEDGFRVGDRGKTRSGRPFEIITDLRDVSDPRLEYYVLVSFGFDENDLHVHEYVNRDGLVDKDSQHDDDLIWETLK